MTWADRDWYDARWAAVPAELKERIVAHLRDQLAPEDLEWIRTQHSEDPDGWATKRGWHFFGGMGIRNLLREVVPDDQLPLAPYPDGDQHANWDDYYVQALEAAAGVRDS
jgi:hypothetical protein